MHAVLVFLVIQVILAHAIFVVFFSCGPSHNHTSHVVVFLVVRVILAHVILLVFLVVRVILAHAIFVFF